MKPVICVIVYVYGVLWINISAAIQIPLLHSGHVRVSSCCFMLRSLCHAIMLVPTGGLDLGGALRGVSSGINCSSLNVTYINPHVLYS